MLALRSALFHLWFWSLSVAMTIAFLPALALPRGVTVWGVEGWVSGILWGLRIFAGIRHEVRGREHLPAGPVLFAAKHFCMWDTLIPHVLLKDPATILKRELLSVPLYGWYARKLAMIPVDRGAHARALKAMVAAAKDRAGAGRTIVIYPEGTRRPVGAAPDYKPGVAALYGQLGLPCVPVALNSGLHWPRQGYLMRPGTIVLELLPAIPPGLKRDAFMAELEQRIETATHRLVEAGAADLRAQPALAAPDA